MAPCFQANPRTGSLRQTSFPECARSRWFRSVKFDVDFPLGWTEPCAVKRPPRLDAWDNKARFRTHDSGILYSVYRGKRGRRYVENCPRGRGAAYGRARGSGPIHSNEYLEGSATAGTPKDPFLVSTDLTSIPYCGDWQGPAPVVTPRACVLQERDDTLSPQIPDAPA
jgi:hypothetical protein